MRPSIWARPGAVAEGQLYFEDFAAGDQFALGAVTIEHADIVAFARQFDPQPMHLVDDPTRPYGGIIASGWHTAALMMRLLVDGLLHKTVNLGSPCVEEIRFRAPVRP